MNEIADATLSNMAATRNKGKVVYGFTDKYQASKNANLFVYQVCELHIM
jgi:hypothetical protein